MHRATWLVVSVWICTQSLPAQEPLNVYILAGQSNMQGHAQVRTFEHLGMDEQTSAMLEEMQNAEGLPKTCEQVWISSIGHDGGNVERHGQLTAGFGAAGNAPKIGPEFTFGIYAQKAIGRPILIIKTAWGGKSLNTDFRPPSAGPYEFGPQQLEDLRKQGKNIDQIQSERSMATGRYYRLMLEHIQGVLGDIPRVYPQYDENAGYQLSGFVWFQGWNDMVDRGTYPDRGQPGGYQQYSHVLAHFIRDIRRDLKAPNMPFVIGVMGVGGPIDQYDDDQQRYAGVHNEFRQAMAAPATLPEFQHNVTAVLTERYWDLELAELSRRWGQVDALKRKLRKDESLNDEARKEALDTLTAELFSAEELATVRIGKSNAEYHYLGSAKIMAQIGRGFAEAILDFEK